MLVYVRNSTALCGFIIVNDSSYSPSIHFPWRSGVLKSIRVSSCFALALDAAAGCCIVARARLCFFNDNIGEFFDHQ